ncbi:DoxX family protein [Aliikangiella sp. IMCC44653]
MNRFNQYSALTGRILISSIFLSAGINKIVHYSATATYMESMGVPAQLLPATIGLEVFGSLALILGYYTRFSAFLLAGFSILSGLLFHFDLSNSMQTSMLLKNFAIAGGFLFLVARGPGEISLDHRLTKAE